MSNHPLDDPERLFAVPDDVTAAVTEAGGTAGGTASPLARFEAVVRALQADSDPAGMWMAGRGFTCDGGALACAIIAEESAIPARLCVGLYWHSDPELRAELMGDYRDDDDVDGSDWARHLRWVKRNAMDEHHHWVVLWPDSPHAVLVDPNGPVRREPFAQLVGGPDSAVYRPGGLAQTYTELPETDPYSRIVYDPADEFDVIADDVYPGLRSAVDTASAAVAGCVRREAGQ